MGRVTRALHVLQLRISFGPPNPITKFHDFLQLDPSLGVILTSHPTGHLFHNTGAQDTIPKTSMFPLKLLQTARDVAEFCFSLKALKASWGFLFQV